jgi:RNA polymerase primary sigma factor
MKQAYHVHSDVVQSHLNRAGKFPLLKRDEEIDLAVEARSGNKSAKDKLICHNLKMVVSIAKRYQNRGLPLEDLIQEGSIGLSVAVDKFDINRGCKFSTHAHWWIFQAITRAVSSKGRIIAIPAYLLSTQRQVLELAREKGFTSIEEIAIALLESDLGNQDTTIVKGKALYKDNPELAIERVSDRLRWLKTLPYGKTLSLSYVVGKDKGAELGNILAGPDNGENDRLLNKDLISSLTVGLPQRYQDVITMHYGLGDEDPLTFVEIGDRLGLSKERARQIESTAIRKIKAQINSREKL